MPARQMAGGHCYLKANVEYITAYRIRGRRACLPVDRDTGQ